MRCRRFAMFMSPPSPLGTSLELWSAGHAATRQFTLTSGAEHTS